MAPKQKTARVRLAFTTLRTCLVNLPGSIAGALHQAGEVAQNVAVELEIPSKQRTASERNDGTTSGPRSVYTGWTGLASKVGPPVPSAYAARRTGVSPVDTQASVEIDSIYGRQLGLYHGQEVALSIHIRPAEVTTINVEPVTPQDWAAIELHAGFLEEHLLSQIRIIPNPVTNEGSLLQPLTVHLSPTATANLVVVSTVPQLPRSLSFLKIAPHAEAIVAPKVASKAVNSTETLRRPLTRLNGGSSAKIARSSSASRQRTSFYRLVDREVAARYFDSHEDEDLDLGFRVWMPRDLLLADKLQGLEWVLVSLIEPLGLKPLAAGGQQVGEEDSKPLKPVTTLVAKLCVWQGAPEGGQVALSSALCSALQVRGTIGGIVGLRDASSCRKGSVKSLRFRPFTSQTRTSETSLRLSNGGDTSHQLENIQLTNLLPSGVGPAQQPLTDGMLVGTSNDPSGIGNGSPVIGLLHFGSSDFDSRPSTPDRISWILGNDCPRTVQVIVPVGRPTTAGESDVLDCLDLQTCFNPLVGVHERERRLVDLLEDSSVLLTGSLGSGKSVFARSLSRHVRRERLWSCHVISCATSFPEEKPLSFVREYIMQSFALAVWNTNHGGHAVVMMDDLDRLCPAETELQVGDQNGRSRQLAEIVATIIQEYCIAGSRITALLTAQSKEALHTSLVSSHVYRHHEVIRTPDKRERSEMLEAFSNGSNGVSDDPVLVPGHNGRSIASSLSTSLSSLDIDFLEIAANADGYVAGDLLLLVERAKVEALIRCTTTTHDQHSSLKMLQRDYEEALKGFTPAALRNVKLQSSQTKWSAIGGLHQVRRTLLETIQFPTLYAPVFKHCPLRLRSGLLLYGYPGCGKTLLASAVAGECGLNFISVKGPEILNKYIGASEKSIRDLFERASSAKPCVLFFDEFESIAPRRGHDSTGVTDRVVNQLLTEMDGAEGLSGVYILAATSRPDLIDPALLRPGRLDKSLMCGLPNEEERLDILRAVSRTLTLSSYLHDEKAAQSLNTLARMTANYSGADLQAVMYNAHLEAVHGMLDASPETVLKSSRQVGDSKEERDTDEDPEYITFSMADGSLGRIPAELPLLKQLSKRAHKHRPLAIQGSQADSLVNQRHADRGAVMITWGHVQEALKSTRPSVPQAEREKLSAIYQTFTSDRSGQDGLPDGQASTEIGGRISLM